MKMFKFTIVWLVFLAIGWQVDMASELGLLSPVQVSGYMSASIFLLALYGLEVFYLQPFSFSYCNFLYTY